MAAPHQFLFHSDDNKLTANNHFVVDELLDFSKEEEDDKVMTVVDAFFTGNSNISSTLAALERSCNSSAASSGTEPRFSGHNSSGTCGSSSSTFTDAQFSQNLFVPYDDLAELEWLSNFVEDSFSTHQLQNLHQIIPATKPSTVTDDVLLHSHPVVFTASSSNHVSVPGKARSKRSRSAPCDWSSRLFVLSPAHRGAVSKKRGCDRAGRKCLHCGSEKTPQWRTGPMGAKTLCNACGVRYKSGRLVAEYRPAASPTFMSTKHSNSHRKVLDLRRQNEMQQRRRQQQQQQFGSESSTFGLSHGHGEEYLINSWIS